MAGETLGGLPQDRSSAPRSEARACAPGFATRLRARQSRDGARPTPHAPPRSPLRTRRAAPARPRSARGRRVAGRPRRARDERPSASRARAASRRRRGRRGACARARASGCARSAAPSTKHISGVCSTPRRCATRPRRRSRCEDQLQPRGRVLLGELSELRDRRLDRARLPQVDETRLLSEDSRQEGRSRAGTPDDEHVLAARLASRKADLAPSAHDESRRGAAVERRSVDGLHDHNLLTVDR